MGTTSTLDDGKNITYTSKEVNQPKQYISGLPSLQLSLRFKSQLSSTKCESVSYWLYHLALTDPFQHFVCLVNYVASNPGPQALASSILYLVLMVHHKGESWSPYFFLVYIDDLPTVVNHCSVSPYANDTVLCCYSSNIKDLENALNEVL